MSDLVITQRHGRTLSPSGDRPPDAPDWCDAIDNPYLHGLFAPTTREVDAPSLEVLAGEIPTDLQGAYFRNGPNPRLPPQNPYHWFDGDGMVYGVWFDDGKARYRNRWVPTQGLMAESERGAAIWPGVLGPFDFSIPNGPMKDTANTDLVVFRGDLLATWYDCGAIYALDPRDLSPRGTQTYGAQITRPVSAHTTVDPHTGDMIYFGYGAEPPFMHYGVVRPDGTVHQIDVPLPGRRFPHDIGVTATHSILHDFPVFIADEERYRKTGRRIPMFHPDVPTRFGVVPRFGTSDQVQWFECESCYMLHVVNSWDEDDAVVMIGCRQPNPSFIPDRRDGHLAGMIGGLTLRVQLYRWRLNRRTGEVQEGPLGDRNLEFPSVAASATGRPNRYAYLQELPCASPVTFEGITKVDLLTGGMETYRYPQGIFGSEAPFAARPNATAEDDGYLMSFVTDIRDWSSACWIFDAQNLTDGPIAKVAIPHRVPAGFHATWAAEGEFG